MALFGLFGSDKKYKQELALQQQAQQAALAAQQAQWAREDQQAQAASAKAAADLEAATAAATAKRTAALGTATNNARTSAADIVSQWGLDPTAYTGKINSAVDMAASGLGDTGDPMSLDGTQIANRLLTGEQNAKRSALTNEANSKFGVDYGDKLIGGNILDSTINELLGTQSGEAQAFLDRGKARGIYNDTGYAAGQAKLGTQADAGRSKLTNLADSVLEGYRTKANDVRDKAYNVAGNATLGQNINLDDYVGQGNAVQAKALDLADDDLTAALGGQNFFDFGGLTNAAGAAQGTGNFRDSSITGALNERNKQRMAARGLGSQGVF